MEVLDLGFSRLEFRPGYVIGRTREGAEIDVEHHRQVIDEVEKRYDGDYGFILDEINSYSVRFGAFVEIRQNPRLRWLAVVAYRPSTYLVAGVAASAINKPVEVFDSLELACNWMDRQIGY